MKGPIHKTIIRLLVVTIIGVLPTIAEAASDRSIAQIRNREFWAGWGLGIVGSYVGAGVGLGVGLAISAADSFDNPEVIVTSTLVGSATLGLLATSGGVALVGRNHQQHGRWGHAVIGTLLGTLAAGGINYGLSQAGVGPVIWLLTGTLPALGGLIAYNIGRDPPDDSQSLTSIENSSTQYPDREVSFSLTPTVIRQQNNIGPGLIAALKF